MKNIYSLNEDNSSKLKNFFFPMTDFRIGEYCESQIIDSLPTAIKSLLTLTPTFNLRTVEEDVNNPVLILPTNFAPNLRDLFEQVYLVMTKLAFNAKVLTDNYSGVEVTSSVNLTPISLIEVTGLTDKNQKETIRNLINQEWFTEIESLIVDNIPAETITDIKSLIISLILIIIWQLRK